MMNKNAPIGVFDSGVGGLTVVKEIMSQNLFRTVCPEMVRCAAAIVEEMLAEYGE